MSCPKAFVSLSLSRFTNSEYEVQYHSASLPVPSLNIDANTLNAPISPAISLFELLLANFVPAGTEMVKSIAG